MSADGTGADRLVAQRRATPRGLEPGLRDAGRLLCAAAILLACALALAHALLLLASLDARSAAPALAGVLLGILAADATSGLVHWACDSWGDEHTPWLGATLIQAFREHHRDPQKMLEHPFTFSNRETGIAAVLALVGLSLPVVHAELATRPLLYAGACSLVVWGAAANQLHRWAHAPRAPRLVRLAQRLGLVLSPQRHARHHAAPNTRAYCISTGWLNPALDRTGFWRALERVIAACTGVEARAQRREDGRFRNG